MFFISRIARRSVVITLLTAFWMGCFSPAVSGQVSVTPIGSGAPNYPTVNAAFAAINAGNHDNPGGTITITISGNTIEPAVPTPLLNAVGLGSPQYNNIQIITTGVYTISGAPVSGRGILEFYGVDNLTIDGDVVGGPVQQDLSIVDNSASGATIGIRLMGTPDAIAQGCTNVNISNVAVSATNTTVTQYGIVIAGSGTIAGVVAALGAAGTLRGERNSNIILNNNRITGCSYGIWAHGDFITPVTSQITDLQITNNTIGTPAAPIRFRFLDLENVTSSLPTNNVIIRNNKMLSITLSPPINKPLDAIRLGFNVSSVIIERNEIGRLLNRGSLRAAAITIDTLIPNITGWRSAHRLFIRNNFIYDINNNGQLADTNGVFGIFVRAGANNDFVNNTISLFDFRLTDADPYALAAPFCAISRTATHLDIRNNIFANSQKAVRAPGFAMYLDVPFLTDPIDTINNNNYYINVNNGALLARSFPSSVTGNPVKYYYTLAEWKVDCVVDAEWDSLSFTDEPKFVSNTDLHLNFGTVPNRFEAGGAPIIQTDVSTDYDGSTRPLGIATAPDVGADELAMNRQLITYDFIPDQPCQATLVATLVQPGASPLVTAGANAPRLYFIKNLSTQPNTYNGNTNLTQGWKYVQGTLIATPAPGVYVVQFSIDYTLLHNAPVVPDDQISYFVIAQDLAGTPALITDGVQFAANPTGPAPVNLTAANFPVSNYHTYVSTGLQGTVSIPGKYPNLTGVGGLFEAVNRHGLAGNTTVLIQDTILEPGWVPLFQWTDKSCPPSTTPYSLRIVPSDTIQILQSNYRGAFIRLIGADRVTFDGQIPGKVTHGLILRNDNSPVGSVISMTSPISNYGGCERITIRNCIIRGDLNGKNTDPGISGTDNYGIRATGINHDSMLIENNKFFNLRTGIDVRGNSLQSAWLDGLIIRNNEIGPKFANDNDRMGDLGLRVSAARNPQIINNTVQHQDHLFLDVFPAALDFSGGLLLTPNNIGIYVDSVNQGLIQNNKIINNRPDINANSFAWGMIVANDTLVDIVGTVVDTLEPTFAGHVIGIELGTQSRNTKLTRSLIRNLHTFGKTGMATGIHLSDVNNDIASQVWVTNNMISGLQGSMQLAGIRFAAAPANNTNVRVIHNSVNLFGNYQGTGVTWTAGIYFPPGVNTNRILMINNIFSNTMLDNGLTVCVGGSRSYAVRCEATPGDVFGGGGVDFNNYWIGLPPLSCQAQVGYVPVPGDRLTVSLWAAATAQDFSSPNPPVNPDFFGPNDLHTLSPDLNDRGTNVFLADVPVDFDTENRPVTGSFLPDIGADDYTPPVYDVKPVGFAQPTPTAAGCLGSAEEVIIRVKNNGLGNPVGSPLELKNGIKLFVSGTIIGPFAGSPLVVYKEYTDSVIGFLDTLDFNLLRPATLDMSAPGTYTFKNFCVTITNDGVTTNNCLPDYVVTNTRPTAGVTSNVNSFSACAQRNVTLLPTPNNVYSNDSIYNIPDNDINGIVAPISVNLPAAVANVALLGVRINKLSHKAVGDLQILLVPPAGTPTYELFLQDDGDRIGSDTVNLENTIWVAQGTAINIDNGTTPFDGVFKQPTGALNLLPASMPAGAANGQWKLLVADLEADTVGTLSGWQLMFMPIEGSTAPGFNWRIGAGPPFANTPIVTPVPTVTTTYTMEIAYTGGCVTSANRQIQVLPNSVEMPLINDTIRICSGSRAVITVTPGIIPGSQYYWYQNNRPADQPPFSDTAFFVGNRYVTSILFEDTVIWVQTIAGNCTSAARKSVLVDVLPIPEAPSVTIAGPICAGERITLRPVSGANTVVGTVFNWYRSNTDSVPFFIGDVFTTPPLEDTTIYFIASVYPGCTSSVRVRVEVPVTPLPGNPSVPFGSAVPVTCFDAPVSITVSGGGAGADYLWYTSKDAPTPFFIGSTYNTTRLKTDSVFWVAAVANGCTSKLRSPIGVKVRANLPLPTVLTDNIKICIGEQAYLEANSPYPLRWFDSPTATVPVATGKYFTSPVLTSSRSYYVATADSECVGPRVEIKVDVGTLTPPVPLLNPVKPVCLGSPAILSVVITDELDSDLNPVNPPRSGSYFWYQTAAGRTPADPGFRGNVFRTPPIVGTSDTFYVQADNGYCRSALVPVVVPTVEKPAGTQIIAPNEVSLGIGNWISVIGLPSSATYEWDFPVGTQFKPIAPGRNDSMIVSFSTLGDVTVTVTAMTGECRERVSRTLTVVQVAGISESAFGGATLQLYPNPVAAHQSNGVSLDLELAQALTFDIEVVDAQGKVIFRDGTRHPTQTYHRQIDLSSTAAGMYSVIVRSGNDQLVRRLIVK